MNAAAGGHQHHATHATAVADLETEMAEEDGSEMTGPARTLSSDEERRGEDRWRADRC
jgi:hypothetical protein